MTSHLGDALRPTALMGQILGDEGKRPGVVAEAVARLAGEGFYRGFGVRPVAEAADRRRIAGIVRGGDLRLTYWLTLMLNDEGLSLASCDPALRKRSVERARENLPAVAECGTTYVGIGSGPDPGPDLRAEATERLIESMADLAQAAWDAGEMHLMIEPFDRGAHKNGLIGPTPEAVGVLRRLREHHANVCISWDAAHAALNGEDVCESLALAAPYVAQIHFANAVLDRDDAGFGDHHMPLGPPGFLDVEKGADLLAAAERAGLFNGDVGLAAEMGTPPDGDPWQTESAGRRFLQEVWDLYLSGGPDTSGVRVRRTRGGEEGFSGKGA